MSRKQTQATLVAMGLVLGHFSVFPPAVGPPSGLSDGLRQEIATKTWGLSPSSVGIVSLASPVTLPTLAIVVLRICACGDRLFASAEPRAVRLSEARRRQKSKFHILLAVRVDGGVIRKLKSRWWDQHAQDQI